MSNITKSLGMDYMVYQALQPIRTVTTQFCGSADYREIDTMPQGFPIFSTAPLPASSPRVVSSYSMPENQPCEYCHGVTVNDMRGNCSACGAPRRK